MDETQGASEERTDTYLTYVEGVPQLVTQRFTKSTGGVPGCARQQAGAAQLLGADAVFFLTTLGVKLYVLNYFFGHIAAGNLLYSKSGAWVNL